MKEITTEEIIKTAKQYFVAAGIVHICNKNDTEDQTFLVCALPFGNDLEESMPPCGMHYGRIAPFARFNYYKEAVGRLKKIAQQLREVSSASGKSFFTKQDFRIFCNSHAVNEKYLAEAAGIGVYGKNGLIITEEAGSLVVLAAMTIPKDLTPMPCTKMSGTSGAAFPLCRNCNACVAVCPSAALDGKGTVQRDKCVQWYASGEGSIIPADTVQNAWGNVFYGCTKCQDVCPHNKAPIAGVKTALGPLPAQIDLDRFLRLSDAEIKQMFKGTCLGLSWPGPAALRRNAYHARRQFDF